MGSGLVYAQISRIHNYTVVLTHKCNTHTHTNTHTGWNILGLCEMRWKNFGETTTEKGHKVFFSGKEDKHEHGVGFLFTGTS